MPPSAALSHVTVIDLTHALAGPFASTMLADQGAEVIKIEPPGIGDMSRTWGPPFYDGESAYFVGLNRNKKSVEIDLRHPEGRALFMDLVEDADVVLENLRPGTVRKLGIDYERVRERQPGIVYCAVSGFGQDGPYRDRTALDLIVQAESGMISVTGPPGGPGVRCGMSIADTAAGMFAAFGVVTALHARDRTGVGQFIDVSMLDGQLSLLQGVIGAYLADGLVPGPWGTAYPTILPYQTFQTATIDIAIGIGSDRLWQAFCRAIALEGLADDPRFATNAARVANRPALITRLQERFLTRSYEEWEALLLQAGVPVGAINTIDRVVAHPHVRARGSLVTCEHPVAGRVPVVGPPIRLSETPGGIATPAPLLGQHTDEVLRARLGLDAAAIDRLRQVGAIGGGRAVAAPAD